MYRSNNQVLIKGELHQVVFHCHLIQSYCVLQNLPISSLHLGIFFFICLLGLESVAEKDSVSEMAKQIKDLSYWVEVAPAPFISLHKTANSPGLESITEEETEGREDDSESQCSSVSIFVRVLKSFVINLLIVY